MIIIPVKEGEAIDRALKRFKRKFDKVGTLREIRSRKNFIKKSTRRREEMLKAKFSVAPSAILPAYCRQYCRSYFSNNFERPLQSRVCILQTSFIYVSGSV